MRIAIIGAGISGLVTAVALRRAGHDINVYEKSDSLEQNYVAAGQHLTGLDYAVPLWCNGTASLDQLGVGEAAAARAEPMKRMEVLDRKERSLFSFDVASMDDWLGSASLMVTAQDLRAALLTALPSDTVRFSRECVALSSNRSIATAQFSDNTEMTFDLIVGADGVHSFVRTAVAPKTRVRSAGFGSWHGVVDFKWQQDDFTSLTCNDGGHQVGVHKLTGDRVGWFVTQNRPLPGNDAASESQLHSTLTNWPEVFSGPILATATDQMFFVREQDLYPLSRWHHSRMVLVGDAAHAMTTGLDQGACQSIADANILLEAMGALIEIKDALAHYSNLRKLRAELVVQQSAKASRSHQRSNPLATWVRKQILLSAPAQAQRQMERFPAGQL
jgi:FAD-dependent urate hydroxylase